MEGFEVIKIVPAEIQLLEVIKVSRGKLEASQGLKQWVESSINYIAATKGNGAEK